MSAQKAILMGLLGLLAVACGGGSKGNKIGPSGSSSGNASGAMSWARNQVSCSAGARTMEVANAGRPSGGGATLAFVGTHRSGGHVLVIERTSDGGSRAHVSLCQTGPLPRARSARFFRPPAISAKRDCPYGDINDATITVDHDPWYAGWRQVSTSEIRFSRIHCR